MQENFSVALCCFDVGLRLRRNTHRHEGVKLHAGFNSLLSHTGLPYQANGLPYPVMLLQVAPITAYWWQLLCRTHIFWQASVQKQQSTYWYPGSEARQAAWLHFDSKTLQIPGASALSHQGVPKQKITEGLTG